MRKGSVGLGLATRRMNVATCQDRKAGKTSAFFLTLSVSVLLINCLASDKVDHLKHMIVDNSIGVIEVMNAPAEWVQNSYNELMEIVAVRKNNEMLAAENRRLLEWYQTANRLNSENKALRDLLNMKDDAALTFQSGRVIADAKTQYSQTILVRLGNKDNLEKGLAVLSHEGLIGRVVETGEEVSRVLLLSDINSRIPVTVEGTHERAILAGTNGGDPILDHLPEGHKIVIGQKIITSGHGGIFPYGVPVGETYMNDEGKMAVRPYADPNRANYVQVVNYGVPAGSARRSVASSATGLLQ